MTERVRKGLTWFKVLRFIAEEPTRPSSPDMTFYQIAKISKIRRPDVQTSLELLKEWGCIRVLKEGSWRTSLVRREYTLTAVGLLRLEKFDQLGWSILDWWAPRLRSEFWLFEEWGTLRENKLDELLRFLLHATLAQMRENKSSKIPTKAEVVPSLLFVRIFQPSNVGKDVTDVGMALYPQWSTEIMTYLTSVVDHSGVAGLVELGRQVTEYLRSDSRVYEMLQESIEAARKRQQEVLSDLETLQVNIRNPAQELSRERDSPGRRNEASLSARRSRRNPNERLDFLS